MGMGMKVFYKHKYEIVKLVQAPPVAIPS